MSLDRRALLTASLALGAALLGPGTALAQGRDEAALARTAVPDTTPQQRYQTAIREAGGGLKVSLEECRAMAAPERSLSCSASRASPHR